MRHKLKIWPQYFCRVLDGSKTFEVRDNDRGFQSGDVVELCEWDPEPINPTDKAPRGFTESPPLEFVIGYIYPLPGSLVVFSLLPFKKPEAKAKKTRK